VGDPATIAEQAKRNGAGTWVLPFAGLRDRLTPLPGLTRAGEGVAWAGGNMARAGGGLAGAGQRAAGRAGRRLRREVSRRLTANLDDRDPDLIRERLPLSWLVASMWYRAEVRNLGNIPERGPVLLVGNHTGGNMSPETVIFTLAFSTYFGVERRFHQLAHNLVLTSPLGPLLRPFGTVAASHENARKALDGGAAVLVFPGGDWEVHRPTWQGSRVDFAGRKGFIRLALEAGVPIVPVVTAGGQETALFLSRGDTLARVLRLDKLLRWKTLPILLAPPWGISVGDVLPRLPLPAKITIEVLPAIDLREQFGAEPDVSEVYEHITGVMQETLDALSAERRYPVIG
jgi:1-acyl-sn-glycerol-3-phosphate acyltransferase